jgi:hypothetical protein
MLRRNHCAGCGMSNNMASQCPFWIGVAGSLVASLIFLAFTVGAAFNIRQSKARKFVGTYKMLDRWTRKPYDGRVVIDVVPWHWKDILTTSTNGGLRAYAEHGNGVEGWTASLEIPNDPSIAVGFFTYRKLHDGGFMRLMLSADIGEITEHATPHYVNDTPFTRILKRAEKKDVTCDPT